MIYSKEVYEGDLFFLVSVINPENVLSCLLLTNFEFDR